MLSKEDILKLEEGTGLNKLICDLIVKPIYIDTKFYAVNGDDGGYYISVDTELEANRWV